jgi:predicted lipid-binding transport protein (Tim44 family)
MLRSCLRTLLAALAVVTVFAVLAADADARPRFSAGSRGSRTFSAPPPTATAPRRIRPIERTMTQPRTTVGQPGTLRAATGSLFNRPGLFGGLAAGFLGAGLFGLLFGHGIAGGLGSGASILGLLLQLVLVAVVARLLWGWWQQRNRPAYAGGVSSRQGEYGEQPSPMSFGGLGGSGGSQPADAPLELKPDDFNAFERLLGEIMTAYGAEDLNALRSRTTPEMLSYFSEELSRNTSLGDHNQISVIKLLQGDLSEAWSEGEDEFATVSMRFSLNDRIVERTTGKLIEQLPSEATELWTFQRARGGNWILAAVQQTED